MGAPLPPVPGVLQVVIGGWIDNDHVEIWKNVLHFRYSGTPPDNTGCETLAFHVSTTWGLQVASLCPSPTTLTHVQVTDLSSDTAGAGGVDVVTPGTRGDDSIAANGAVLISYDVALRYKGGHPRTYLYVLGNADFEGAMHWNATATSEVLAKWKAFISGCIGGTAGATVIGTFCVVRRKGKYLPNGGPPHYYLTNPLVANVDVSQFSVHTQVASQRGRIGRRSA